MSKTCAMNGSDVTVKSRREKSTKAAERWHYLHIDGERRPLARRDDQGRASVASDSNVDLLSHRSNYLEANLSATVKNIRTFLYMWILGLSSSTVSFDNDLSKKDSLENVPKAVSMVTVNPYHCLVPGYYEQWCGNTMVVLSYHSLRILCLAIINVVRTL